MVQVAIDTTLDEVVLAEYPLTMLSVALVAVASATILSLIMVKHLLRPLQLIVHQIGTIDHSRLDTRVRLSGLTCELQQLGLTFNNLMGDLERAYQGLRQYADNVAHEVRTPLNNMLLGLELAGQGGRDAETYEEAIDSVQDECRQLVTLVDRLLFLARVDSKQAEIERRPINISSEIQRIHAYFEASAAEAGIRLTCSPGEAVVVSGDKVLLRRAIANLVANALAHTPKGGAVHIGAQRKAASVEITVSDTGTGIEEADLPYVFDRFYRADPSHSSKFARVGLGLPIAKSIAELHAGSISLTSGMGRGTLARITLPIVEPATRPFR
jgi:two-component system heavy metal sensor histidine kinase CusS